MQVLAGGGEGGVSHRGGGVEGWGRTHARGCHCSPTANVVRSSIPIGYTPRMALAHASAGGRTADAAAAGAPAGRALGVAGPGVELLRGAYEELLPNHPRFALHISVESQPCMLLVTLFCLLFAESQGQPSLLSLVECLLHTVACPSLLCNSPPQLPSATAFPLIPL